MQLKSLITCPNGVVVDLCLCGHNCVLFSEGSSDKTFKKKKKPTTDKSTSSKEKVKADSSVIKPKVKPTFQAPKQEKTLKPKVATNVAPELELDSQVFTMELSCKDVESVPKKKAVKKIVPKTDVANNDKENVDPKSKTTSVDKTGNKSKFVVKPKFSLSNTFKAMKTKSKDDSTDVPSSQDNERKTVATTKKKQFSIKKTSANDKTDGQRTSDGNPAAEKTKEDIDKETTPTPSASPSVDNVHLNIEDGEETAPTPSTSPSVDNVHLNIEDNLFPDLDLTSADTDARRELDEDNDSEPFDMDGGDGVITEMITDVMSGDKLISLNDGFDSQPMEFEE